MKQYAEGQNLNRLDDSIDKTPATITKYKSGRGKCYSLNIARKAKT